MSILAGGDSGKTNMLLEQIRDQLVQRNELSDNFGNEVFIVHGHDNELTPIL